MSKISLSAVVKDLSVDHFAIEKEDILNINEYLMEKGN